MAVILQITYSKKLGLPNFSSHSCSVSVQVEIADVSQVAEQNERLYQVLQASVDKEIQAVGYLPDATKYGMNGQPTNGNGHHTTERRRRRLVKSSSISSTRSCVRTTPTKAEVENLAVEMFGGGVRTLNRMQASNFIDALFEKYPRNGNGQRAKYPRQPARAS